MATADRVTVDEVLTAHPWQPIRNCPGRLGLAASMETPAELLGVDARVSEHRSPAARDIVVITLLADGGLISYRRDDGSYLHTLNTRDGFARKLAQLGLADRVERSA
jgi:hypothetical protein